MQTTKSQAKATGHSSVSSRPLILGLTGGMAAGKSLVARMFAKLGAAVWEADAAAKTLYQIDAHLREAMILRWGAQVVRCDEHGKQVDVHRQAVADIVFADAQELAWLESRVHPAVGRAFALWLEEQAQIGEARVVVREAAILFESGSDASCDVTVTVEAPETLRIARAQHRAQAEGQPVPEEADIRARMDRQWTEAQRTARADHVVRNTDGTAILPQVLDIWNRVVETRR